MKRYLYRFTSPIWGHRFTKTFTSDKEAFEYADSMVDGPELARIEKWSDGDWFDWDTNMEGWVYNPNAMHEKVSHFA